MKIKDIEKKIGTLSNPSKMPSYAWGISAKHCNVGSKLAKIKGTICNKCYALKGHYSFKNVFNAHEIRRKAIELPEWVDYMAELLTQKYKKQGTGFILDIVLKRVTTQVQQKTTY